MAFKDIMGKVADSTDGPEGILKEKVNEWLDECKKAVAVMKTLGFTVTKFSIDMSIPPQIHTSFSGSVNNISEDGVKKIIEEHQSEKLTVLLGNALIMTKKFWNIVEVKATGVTLDVTLGLTPSINVKMDDANVLNHRSINE